MQSLKKWQNPHRLSKGEKKMDNKGWGIVEWMIVLGIFILGFLMIFVWG